MAAKNENGYQFGSLIAVEGDKDVISTQLRLLPPSSKILIMGPLTDALQQPYDDETFSPRAFVREVHEQLSSRSEVARSFLKDSTEEQPRLVFMNGGSVSARVTCVTKISERLTNGEIKAAEDIFQEVVEDGVAGMMREGEERPHGRLLTPENWLLGHIGEEQNLDGIEVMQEDPSMVAMKAAESLDRDTAELQTSDEDEVEDIDIQGISQSYLESNGDLPGLPPMGESLFTDTDGAIIQTTLITVPPRSTLLDDQRDIFGGIEAHSSVSNPGDATSHHNDIDDGQYLLSSLSRRGSEPPTPGLVEIGEACIVDVGLQPIRRVKSVDRFSERRPISLLLHPSPPVLRPVASAQNLKTDGSADVGSESYRLSFYSRSLETLPRTTFVRASQTLIRRTPPVSRQISFEPNQILDHKADVEKIRSFEMVDVATQFPEDATEQVLFEPVFPIVEDLIIHFTQDTRNEIREAVIRSYMNGTYPITPSVPSESISSPSEASSPSPGDKRSPLRPESHMTAETDDDGYHRRQEFDPYNSDSYRHHGKALWRLQEHSKKGPHPHIGTQIAEPLTPASTPPPTLSGNGQKFQEFTPLNTTTPIAMHNSLRSILNMHFPSETKNYKQHTNPEETNRLWMPVFRNYPGLDGRTVDQILAIGCEDGVEKDFYNGIVGQVAKLGMKKSGICMTGRLDISYLITVAMQAYASQPLAAQTGEDPFSQRSLLATLLVPHLETYLSTNESTRFLLLTYPASHLSTVLELRKLLGSSILKIAGIVDSSAGIPTTEATKSKNSAPPNPLSNEGVASFQARHNSGTNRSRAPSASKSLKSAVHSISSVASHTCLEKPVPLSFSKANFLLPSAATATERSTFLNAITTSLVSISSFYIPESEPAPKVQASIRHARPPIPHQSSTSKSELRSRSPKTSTGSRKIAGGHHSTKSTNSARVRRENNDRDWENFYIGPEESEEDDLARRLMPRLVAKEMRKVNSRKALKVLGLS